jgi:hypothetical protein
MPVEPPRDPDGNTLPHDHAEIQNEHHVIRHITPYDLFPDRQTHVKRVQSGAYSESSDQHGGMSVDIEEWMTTDGLDTLHYVHDPSYGAKRINVGELRAQGFQVGWDSQPGNPHHGAVWGIGNGSKRKRRIAALAVTIRAASGEGQVDDPGGGHPRREYYFRLGPVSACAKARVSAARVRRRFSS